MKAIVLVSCTPVFGWRTADPTDSTGEIRDVRRVNGSRTIRTLDYSYRPWTIRTMLRKATWFIQCESKKSPLRFSDIFFHNGWKFSDQVLQAYCTFIPTVDYKFLSNYLKF